MPTTTEAAKLARVDQLAATTKRLRDSIAWLRDGQMVACGIGVADMEVMLPVLTAAMAQAEGEPVENPLGWKVGNEFAPYHPQASHCNPDYRDGWNHCYEAARPFVRAIVSPAIAKLAAQPAHQVPELTDERIEDLFSQHFPRTKISRAWVRFARAIEAELRAAPRQEKP